MHFYSKARRFWGGSGIVGAQVPVGVGLGFANMYLAKKAWPTTISVAMYGDGAANQGQIWEAANMAKLWSIPTILLCENNQYGMGTSTARHSANAEYYKAGGVAIPGVQADGMDVLAVKEAVKYCRQHACVLAAGRRRRRCAARPPRATLARALAPRPSARAGRPARAPSTWRSRRTGTTGTRCPTRASRTATATKSRRCARRATALSRSRRG